jgi:hypothetical protein
MRIFRKLPWYLIWLKINRKIYLNAEAGIQHVKLLSRSPSKLATKSVKFEAIRSDQCWWYFVSIEIIRKTPSDQKSKMQ